jgi:hypothetical protein
MQLTVVEHAFRVLKSELLLRPVWHHYSGRTKAHVMVCVLAYALWKTLDGTEQKLRSSFEHLGGATCDELGIPIVLSAHPSTARHAMKNAESDRARNMGVAELGADGPSRRSS